MPAKRVNEKAEAAKERKAAAKSADKSAKEKAAEDAYWRAQGEGQKTKGQAKKEEEERKRQEAAARKAELKRLEAEEAAALIKPKTDPKKAARVSGPKVTHHELSQLREAEQQQREAELREKALAARREVSADSYSRSLDVVNTNREEDTVEARSVEQAIEALAVAEPAAAGAAAVDKHPEKRMRAAYKAFEEHNMPLLRMEKPNLKQSQYRDLLWKMWAKSPDNPLNQAAAAAQ